MYTANMLHTTNSTYSIDCGTGLHLRLHRISAILPWPIIVDWKLGPLQLHMYIMATLNQIHLTSNLSIWWEAGAINSFTLHNKYQATQWRHGFYTNPPVPSSLVNPEAEEGGWINWVIQLRWKNESLPLFSMVLRCLCRQLTVGAYDKASPTASFISQVQRNAQSLNVDMV